MPTNDIAGTYVYQDDPRNVLELRTDRTLYLRQQGQVYQGTYKVKGTSLTLKIRRNALFSSAVRATISNGIIVDEDGENWVKQ